MFIMTKAHEEAKKNGKNEKFYIYIKSEDLISLWYSDGHYKSTKNGINLLEPN